MQLTKQSRLTLKHIAYAIGTAAFVASVAFLVFFVAHNWAAMRSIQLVVPSAVALSMLIYAVSHISTGLSWPLAVRSLGTPIPLALGLNIGLIAQIGKYLPGNVAHYFGRATIAAEACVTIKTTGISTVVEIFAAILAAVIVAGVAMLIDPSTYGYVALQVANSSYSTLLTLCGFVLVTLTLAILMRRKAIDWAVVVAPTICLCISFLLSGLSMAALLWGFGIDQLSVASVVTIFAVAWLAGFLIPGAPAGLGIREAVLIGFIAPQIGPGAAAACALMHRILTAIVDMLAAFIGYAAWTLSKKKKSANEVLSGSATSQE